MKSKMHFFANQSSKRARTTARRLTRILRELGNDPFRHFNLHSEASALAAKVSYFLREAETGGRIILTDDGKRRQVFLVDNLNCFSSGKNKLELP
jgi:hypothetical protein